MIDRLKQAMQLIASPPHEPDIDEYRPKGARIEPLPKIPQPEVLAPEPRAPARVHAHTHVRIYKEDVCSGTMTPRNEWQKLISSQKVGPLHSEN
jgi:hypothetical protein